MCKVIIPGKIKYNIIKMCMYCHVIQNCDALLLARSQQIAQALDGPTALMKSFTRLFTMVGLTSALSDTMPFFLTLNTCCKTEVLPIAAFITAGNTVAYNVATNTPETSIVGACAYCVSKAIVPMKSRSKTKSIQLAFTVLILYLIPGAVILLLGNRVEEAAAGAMYVMFVMSSNHQLIASLG